MSTGISMSSVNKIKELADNGDYSLALDILEHQDLSKSLSPQFIRICGEVYYENKRYPEARAALVKAHAMAPAGNKIIYSLIKLYLSMGFTQLAEHYFEIYTFNQANKDAGTYRLEYMIAKAHRKPVNELYSILVSANDVETDEEWDFEMLLLHAYIRNREKFDSACVEFRAHYKNSSHLYMLDKLMGGDVDLESMIYCYPDTEMSDDDPEQADTRANENKILEEDDLRMHPKDAKIMIMVEDDAPVTSSMKFKQMWIRSKDKKEQKKEARQEEENSEPKKKSRGLFGLMSRKEEELVEQEMESLKNENLDKEQLFEEVISDTADDAGNELKAMSSDSEKAPEGKSQDMTEISGELTPEDAAVYNKDNDNEYEDSEPVEEDNYVIEEEPEEVVMVEVDGDDSDDVSDSASDRDSEDDTVVETFDPEFEGDFEDGFEADAEPETLPDEPVESETFDFDKAFESLEEFEVDDENLEDLMEDAESQNDVEETAVEPGVEQNEPEVDEVSVEIEPEIEEEFEVDADSEPEFEKELEVGAEFTIEAEPEAEEEFTVEAEPEVEEEFTIDAEAEIEDEFETEAEPELEEFTIDAESKESEMEEVPVEVEPEVEEFEAEAELEIEETEAEAESEVEEEFTMEAEDKSEEKIAVETEPEKPKNNGFPVFKSSLFPDYNTENAALYDLSAEKDINAEIEADEAKISESLKKEEDLIGETDRLLARLGIKFNTEFNSILNFDDEDKEDDVAAPDEEKTDEQESPQQETVDAEPEQPKKKPFRLKG